MGPRVIIAMLLLGLMVVLGAIIMVFYAQQLPLSVDVFVGSVAVAAAWLLWLILRLADRRN